MARKVRKVTVYLEIETKDNPEQIGQLLRAALEYDSFYSSKLTVTGIMIDKGLSDGTNI